jgi:hypothetical protein
VIDLGCGAASGSHEGHSEATERDDGQDAASL